MKKILCLLLIFCLALPLIGCESSKSFINGVNLSEFSIVYSEEDSDYSKRAAGYIQDMISERTELELPVIEDNESPRANEIVVGNTNRAISAKLDADTEGVEFAILAEGGSVALEGDYFIIAAAAYFFVENYVPTDDFDATVPEEVKVHNPIIKDAKNFIMLIGDGMGVYQTRIFEYMENDLEYGDGEDIFYGSYLPYMGYSRTESLSGVTDSAAGGTALSSGHKTYNEYIGRDKDQKDVKLLTELASELGMGAGVMSTETNTGATPASFSAHADGRDDSYDIRLSQSAAKKNYGIKINCGFNQYSESGVNDIETALDTMLSEISEGKDGFFLMYEEAYIDKHCHNNDLEATFEAMVRFNQAIGRAMEYAFYNPETFVLITADHETGDLCPNDEGALEYHTEEHTAHKVPVFTYGKGAELFDGVEMENIQIAHTIASFMGVYDFGDQSVYQYLGK